MTEIGEDPTVNFRISGWIVNQRQMRLILIALANNSTWEDRALALNAIIDVLMNECDDNPRS